MTELPVARVARDRYGFPDPLLAPDADPASLIPARRLARRMAERGVAGSAPPPRPRQLQAMAVIHEAMHRVLEERLPLPGDAAFGDALGRLAAEIGRERVDEALLAFSAEFPAAAVYRGDVDPRGWVTGVPAGSEQADGDRRAAVLEELLLLWLENRNPAFMRHAELFDDRPLARASLYGEIVEALRTHLRSSEGTGGEDLVALLLAPAQAAPGSLAEQLRYIREHWPGVADLVDRLAGDLELLAAVERGESPDDAGEPFDEPVTGGGGPGPADAAALHGFAGLDEEVERYSPDRDWMPRVVLMAKSTYVWLDQLSREYGRPIRTLDAIPLEELDRLASRGITGLWLIGVWERSHASREIKQRRGNPEAVASAYSLLDYRISEDLGGEDAFAVLREHAMQRGIRLACDMVPNHMGIDSRWVVERPDLFIWRPDVPYPSHAFTGPNLSNDERVGIYLEDHYYDGTDAAVVFKRVDRWSGEERYVYHGNDGTGMPWNDTAQLDYLREDVRRAVMDTIIEVARRAPIIRFDAAMTLARRHVQRLWYPLPGAGESIPTRAESALSAEEFAARMPEEFWREVVDRVAQEAPDTLLLAEAFWLMEGYFVRTLGMHRVYNSAFMVMLRDEDNAGYRKVIRNTLEFDPRILKRYVDFMSNPDERTAVDQFGDGDKYFGVATMMATLPGLPMFGHGQFEGLAERYGMEFRRARLDERPDETLIARHEREIVPLLHDRWRFAEADEFRLYDVVTDDGTVAEDVFAYSNRAGHHTSLVVFQNRYGDVHGRLRASVGFSAAGEDGERRLVTQTLAEALGLPADPDAWLVLRDARSGREWLRPTRALHDDGLDVDLRAYECLVFLDPEVRREGPGGDLARLARRIGAGPVPSVDEALRDLVREPVRDAVRGLLEPAAFRRIAGAALGGTEAAMAAALDREATRVREALARLAAGAGADRDVEPEATRLEERLRTLVTLAREGRRGGGGSAARSIAGWLRTDRARWTAVLAWLHADAAGRLLGPDGAPDEPVGVGLAGWGLDGATIDAARSLGTGDAEAWRAWQLCAAFLAMPDEPFGQPLARWWLVPDVRAAAGWNEWQGTAYVGADAFRDLVEALEVRELVRVGAASDDAELDAAADAIAERAADLVPRVEAAGWRVDGVDPDEERVPESPDGGATQDEAPIAEDGAPTTEDEAPAAEDAPGTKDAS